MEAAAIAVSAQALQSSLQVLTALQLTGFLWKQQSTVQDGDTFDFIIVGGGTAGSVLANRLTENENFNVLVIEAGGDPPLESMLPGLFPYQPNSTQDWNFSSENDGYTAQNHKNKKIELTQGKMLGGSSSLDHLLHVRGNPHDFTSWAEAAGDESWGWDGLYPYFLKSERLEDTEILDSIYKDFHGTEGFIVIKREPHDDVIPYLDAFEELGFPKVLTHGNDTLGFSCPLFTISRFRQSNAYAFLNPAVVRPNLKILKNTLVTKIIFNGTVAVGVEALTENNVLLSIYADKEVIISAGAFNTPKLLMLSGIGPNEHLKSLDIEVISHLPVGQNLQDHIPVMILHKMEASNATETLTDPTAFPVPCFTGYVALDKSQTYPDYQSIGLLFPPGSQNLLAFCSIVFSYDDQICQAMYEASLSTNMLFTVHNILHPKSRGKIELRSKDPADPPLIYTGAFSDVTDLENEALYVENYLSVINTTFFKSVGAEVVDLGVTQCADLEFGSSEYWKCYTLYMMGTMYHYSSTCSMGSVVDAGLKVFGVSQLRVVDASIMPTTTSGNIKAPVLAIAEKAADMITEEHGTKV